MYFVLKIMNLNIGGTNVKKIVHVHALQVKPTSLTNHSGEGDFLYQTDEEMLINQLLNDQENVIVRTVPTTDNSLNVVTLDFGSASDEPSARKINDADWKVRVRPAFMRAATTTHFFNN